MPELWGREATLRLVASQSGLTYLVQRGLAGGCSVLRVDSESLFSIEKAARRTLPG